MIGRTLTTLLALLLVFTVTLTALLGSQSGSHWLTRTLLEKAGARAEHIEGTLLDRLTLHQLRWQNGQRRLRVERLQLSWLPTELLHGRIHITWMSAAGVRWQAPTATAQPATHLTLPDALPSVRVDQLQIRDIRWNGMSLTAVTLSATATRRQLALHSLMLRLRDKAWQGSGVLRLEPQQRLNLSLRWTLHGEALPTLAGEGRLHGPLDRLELEHRFSAPVPARLHGLFNALNEHGELTLTVPRADWPLQGAPRLTARTLTLHWQGQPQDYRLSLHTRLHPSGYVPITLHLDGMGDLRQFRATRLNLRPPHGAVSGSGMVDWAQDLHWQLTLTGRALDPGDFHPGLSGRLGFSARLDGKGRQAHLTLDPLHGQLNDRPLRGRAKVRWNGAALHIDALTLTQGEGNRLSARGILSTQRAKVHIHARLAALNALLPESSGQLRGDMSLEGPWQQLEMGGMLEGDHLRWRAWRVDRLTTRLNLQAQRLQGRLSASNVTDGHHTLQQVALTLDGTPQRHGISLHARHANGRLDARLSGGLENHQRWHGHLNTLRLALPHGLIRLERVVPLILSTRSASMHNLCLQLHSREDSGRLCAEGAWREGRSLSLSASLQNAPLALLAPLLPEQTALSGHADGQLELAGPMADPHGRLQGRIDAEMRHAGQRLTLQLAPISLRLARHRLSGHIQLADTARHASGQFTFTLNDLMRSRDPDLDGRLRLTLPDLAVLQPLLPSRLGVDALRGRAEADLHLDGTLRQPHLKGVLAVRHARFNLLSTGTHIDAMNLTLNVPDYNRPLAIRGQLRSGKRTLNLEGRLSPLTEAEPHLNLHLTGSAFPLLDLPEARARVSPDLRLALDRHTLTLRGTVHVPDADIRIPTLPPKAVDVSPDAKVVGTRHEHISHGPAMDVQINVILGDRVRLRALGLDTRLAGDLMLHQKTPQPPGVYGAISLKEGYYSRFGVKLRITRGQLIFAGPPDNPALDVVAQRQVEETLARLHLSGTLQQPRTELSTEPPMSQADALALLLTGRPVAQSSRKALLLMAQVAYALNVQDDSGSLTQTIQQKLGVDELSVKGGDTLQEARLVLGKYLSPALYVRLSSGLFESTNVLTLSYRLSRHLTLEAQAGAIRAVDLLFQRQFD
ncbi:translocation/assembly module TamB domain-containing protein [Sulfurivirga sp.]|uniref:translocation/assembly module TamB domain-containing protein n=1 Tax=Sulfurivirga sp. TaxID=2614236 RepID=UPI0025D70F13|nr:translocation/assembly module TamB domain-containing protein [Sulfurivirga sp.]